MAFLFLHIKSFTEQTDYNLTAGTIQKGLIWYIMKYEIYEYSGATVP